MNCQLILPHINSSSAEGGSSESIAVGMQHDKMLSPQHGQSPLDELLRIHEYERQRLGQELHDSTGQLVVVLLLSLARLRAIEKDCALGGLIDDIQDVVRQIDKEIRSLAFLHYPAALAGGCLAASIEGLTVGFGRRTGMPTTFKCKGGEPSVDATVSTALLRIAQEALVNVHRHSRATSAKIELKTGARQVELRITDDGIGLPDADVVRNTSGIGLLGMRYRVESHGGRFEVRNIHPGTMVRAIMPTAQ